MRMKLRMTIAASVIVALLAPGTASAQTQPVRGGTAPVCYAPIYLELSLTRPVFSKSKAHKMSFDATVTTTIAPVRLSVAGRVVTTLTDVITSAKTRVTLPQKLARKSTGTGRKLVLVTLSTETP